MYSQHCFKIDWTGATELDFEREVRKIMRDVTNAVNSGCHLNEDPNAYDLNVGFVKGSNTPGYAYLWVNSLVVAEALLGKDCRGEAKSEFVIGEGDDIELHERPDGSFKYVKGHYTGNTVEALYTPPSHLDNSTGNYPFKLHLHDLESSKVYTRLAIGAGGKLRLNEIVTNKGERELLMKAVQDYYSKFAVAHHCTLTVKWKQGTGENAYRTILVEFKSEPEGEDKIAAAAAMVIKHRMLPVPGFKKIELYTGFDAPQEATTTSNWSSTPQNKPASSQRNTKPSTPQNKYTSQKSFTPQKRK